jgi:hypothetical protein
MTATNSAVTFQLQITHYKLRLTLAMPPGRATLSGIGPSRNGIQFSGVIMAEKVKQLNLPRDYKKYLYFIDGNGNVCQKPKSGEGDSQVLVENAVERDNRFLYFIDKDGDIARSERGSKGSKSKKVA